MATIKTINGYTISELKSNTVPVVAPYKIKIDNKTEYSFRTLKCAENWALKH